jgi:ribonuclease J
VARRRGRGSSSGSGSLRVLPLGGLDEIGKNMMVLEYGDDMILIDAGLMFPDEEMLGVDLVLPDFSYVTQRADKLRGILITHGHEDHVGALPYLLRDVHAPIFATKLTVGLIAGRLEEHRLPNVQLNEVKPGQTLQLGAFECKFMRVNHSIPDCAAILVKTPVGTILDTGDFKFDNTPIDSQVMDLHDFAAAAGRVDILMSDSTNAEIPGYSISERTVGDTLREIFSNAKGKVILASFASHIHRMQQVFDIAHEQGRLVAVTGRSMNRNVTIAHELDYLHFDEGEVFDVVDMPTLPRNKQVILSTGSQGEPLSALARMAAREHRWITVERGDTVIISATPVPGNEKAVHRVIDRLLKLGAHVFYRSISAVHVSGHAAQEELKLMMNMVRPKYFVPIHGEYRHLQAHAGLARQVGIPEENVFVIENGDTLELTPQGVRLGERVGAGVVFVDGLGVGDIGSVVLRDRRQLSKDGIMIVVVTVSVADGAVLAPPDVITRGFVYVKESADLIDDARAQVEKALKRTQRDQVTDWTVLKAAVRDSLQEFLWQRTGRRPVIMPIVVEV